MQAVRLGRLLAVGTQYIALVPADFAIVHRMGLAVQGEEQDTQIVHHTVEGECKGVVHIELAAQTAVEVGDKVVGTAAGTAAVVVGSKQAGAAVVDTRRGLVAQI